MKKVRSQQSAVSGQREDCAPLLTAHSPPLPRRLWLLPFAAALFVWIKVSAAPTLPTASTQGLSQNTNGNVTATNKITYVNGLAVTNAPTAANDVPRLTDLQGATNTIAAGSLTGTAADSVYPNALLRDGSRAATAPMNLGGFNLTNMLAGTELLHAVNLAQLQGATNGLDTVAARNAAIGGATNAIAAGSLTGTAADSIYPNAVLRDGSRSWTAPHNAGNQTLTNLAPGTAPSHGVTLGQLNSSNAFYVLKSGDTMSGALSITGSANVVHLTIIGRAGQTTNLFELRDSSLNVLSYIDSAGSAHFPSNSVWVGNLRLSSDAATNFLVSPTRLIVGDPTGSSTELCLASSGGNARVSGCTNGVLNSANLMLDGGGSGLFLNYNNGQPIHSYGTHNFAYGIVGNDATESTSPSTGAIKTIGGVGIAKKLNVGGASLFYDQVKITNGVLTIVASGANVQMDNQSTNQSAGLLLYQLGVLKAAYSYNPITDRLVFGYGGSGDITIGADHVVTFGSPTLNLDLGTFSNGVNMAATSITNMAASTAPLGAVNYNQLTNQVHVVNFETNLTADLSLAQNTTSNVFSYTSTLGAGALITLEAGGQVQSGAMTVMLVGATQLRGSVWPTAETSGRVHYSFVQSSNTTFTAAYAGDNASPSLYAKRNYIDGFQTNLTYFSVTEIKP